MPCVVSIGIVIVGSVIPSVAIIAAPEAQWFIITINSLLRKLATWFSDWQGKFQVEILSLLPKVQVLIPQRWDLHRIELKST